MPSSENFPTITAVPSETPRMAKAHRPPAGNLDFSIVIPVYNEAGIIENTLREVDSYLSGYAGGHSWEIVVINDGSEDDTLNRLMALGREMANLSVLDLGCHKGRGMALRQGIGQARGEIIVSIDADLSYAPYHIERMIEAMRRNKADLVLASAYCPGGTVEHVPFKRLFLSQWGNKLLSLMFGGKISTFTCMVRAYRRDFISRLDLHSDDKEIHLEILYKTRILGGIIVEVPANLCWREEKLRKIDRQKSGPKRRSTLATRKIGSSHLFFALLNRPGLIFWLPGYGLLALSLAIFINILIQIINNYPQFNSFYFVLRHSIKVGLPSWITMIACFIIGVQFFTLGFITAQNKRNHDELYRTLNAIYNRKNEEEEGG